MDDEEHHGQAFEESADAGRSSTYLLQCSALRKDGHVVIKNRPCKIVDVSTSKTHNQDSAGVRVVGIDIFTGKKYEDMAPPTHNMDVPNVTRNVYQLVDISDDFLSLMNEDGGTKDDVRLPAGELGKAIADDFDAGKELLLTVISAMGEEAVISHKEA